MRLRILLLLVLLAGCGISPTGVQDGGEPGSGFQPSMRLYFVSGQRLKAATRPMPWPSLKETLNLLVDGPSRQEQQLGLGTELESWIGTLGKVTSDDAKVRIAVEAPTSSAAPMPVPRETIAAQRDRLLWLGQLTCTAAAALAAQSNIDPDAVRVEVRRERENFGSFRCSEFPRAAE
ncbi:hypothetical protein [Herbidospora mongoliensis]|uniref:hypothetical protein n=1 Tax=Herbidospora mongoliensis TaxID=688067 RepID=UPI000A420DFF|nr:hypothetical protein [Herbidospora mongoliensis]